MPVNVHSNIKFLMPSGEDVGIEDLENTITTDDITNFKITSPQSGDVLVYDEEKQVWYNVSPSLPAGTFSPSLQSYGEKYMTGFHPVFWAGEERTMNVSLYGGKAWVEIYWSHDSSVSAPWDNGYITGDYYLQSYRSSFGDVQQVDYSDGVMEVVRVGEDNVTVEQGNTSCLILGGEIVTNVLFTAKGHKLDGINHSAVLECSHLSATDRAKFTDYFTGVTAGFEVNDAFGLGGGAGLYDCHLSYRSGSFRNGEWMIQDSIEGNSHGTPRWGYRKSGSDNIGAKQQVSISVRPTYYRSG